MEPPLCTNGSAGYLMQLSVNDYLNRNGVHSLFQRVVFTKGHYSELRGKGFIPKGCCSENIIKGVIPKVCNYEGSLFRIERKGFYHEGALFRK